MCVEWDGTKNPSAPFHLSCLFRRGSFKKLTKQMKISSYLFFYKEYIYKHEENPLKK